MSAFLASTLHVSLIQRWGHGERLRRGFLLPVSRRCMGALALVLADARVPYCVAPLCLLPAESHGTDVSPMNRVALGSGHLLSRSVGTTAFPPVLELLGRHLVLSHGHHMGGPLPFWPGREEPHSASDWLRDLLWPCHLPKPHFLREEGGHCRPALWCLREGDVR